MSSPEPSLQIGDRVCLRSTGEEGYVVRAWVDEHGDTDTYVCFVDECEKNTPPTEKPYVLRYSAASLGRLPSSSLS